MIGSQALGWLAVFAVAMLAPERAHACAAPRCIGGSLAPADTGAVPANLPGLLWRPLIDQTAPADADPSKLTITGPDNAQVAFAARALAGGDILVVPDAPLVVGETYLLSDATTCGGASMASQSSFFEVRAAAPLPATLGTLAASDQAFEKAIVPTPSGACTAEVDAASRTIWLQLDPGVDAWLDLLQLRAFVDDQPWSRPVHTSSEPAGTRAADASVQVYRTCASADAEADRGLATGMHTVRIEATLPGSTVHVVSNAVTFELDCTPAPAPADGGGCNSAGASASIGVALSAIFVRRRRRRG